MKTVAYLRVSTRSQDLANQKLAILEFSQKRRFPIDRFIESRISSRQSPLERRIDEMLGTLEPGDRLLVSELSRLGRSLSQVIQIVETLVRRKIRFIAIKEAIEFDGKQDLRTKVMIALFGLFAEVERDLISERTKEGLAAAKAKGKLLGRPKGALGTSRLDGKEQDIRALLGKDVSKTSIAKILDVSRSACLPLHPDRQDRSGLTPRLGPPCMLYFNTNVGATPDKDYGPLDPVVNRKERTIRPRLDHRALGQDRTVLRGVRERPDHRVCRTQASGRPWAEESLLPSDPRARPRLQDRVHPRLPESAGALRARIRRGLLKGEQLHVGETWRSGLSSTKPNFLRSISSRPAHFSKQPG